MKILVTCEQYEDRALITILFTRFFDEFQAVHDGHFNVCDNDVRIVDFQHIQSNLSVGGRVADFRIQF